MVLTRNTKLAARATILSALCAATCTFPASGQGGSFELTEVSHPTRSSVVSVQATAEGLFVGSGATLQIYDIELEDDELTGLELLGEVQTRGELRELEVHGSYVYAASASEGLQIFDVSLLDQPKLCAHYKIEQAGTSGMGLHVEGDHTYLAMYEGGLHRIDTSAAVLQGCQSGDVVALQDASIYANPFGNRFASDVIVKDQIAHIGYTNSLGQQGGIATVDFGSGAPTLLGEATELNNCPVTSMERSGDFVFVSCRTYNTWPLAGHVELIVFQDEGSQLSQRAVLDDGLNWDAGEDLEVVALANGRHRIYLAGGIPDIKLSVSSKPVKVIDFDPSKPEGLRLDEIGAANNINITFSLSVVGDLLFVADEWAGILPYRLEDGMTPQLLDSALIIRPGGWTADLAIHGSTLAVADEGAGFWLITDVNTAEQDETLFFKYDPNKPGGDTNTFANAIDIDDEYIVTLHWTAVGTPRTVRVHDIEDPDGLPTAVFSAKDAKGDSAYAVARHESAIYVATRRGVAVATDWESCNKNCEYPTTLKIGEVTDMTVDHDAELLYVTTRGFGRKALHV